MGTPFPTGPPPEIRDNSGYSLPGNNRELQSTHHQNGNYQNGHRFNNRRQMNHAEHSRGGGHGYNHYHQRPYDNRNRGGRGGQRQFRSYEERNYQNDGYPRYQSRYQNEWRPRYQQNGSNDYVHQQNNWNIGSNVSYAESNQSADSGRYDESVRVEQGVRSETSESDEAMFPHSKLSQHPQAEPGSFKLNKEQHFPELMDSSAQSPDFSLDDTNGRPQNDYSHNSQTSFQNLNIGGENLGYLSNNFKTAHQPEQNQHQPDQLQNNDVQSQSLPNQQKNSLRFGTEEVHNSTLGNNDINKLRFSAITANNETIMIDLATLRRLINQVPAVDGTTALDEQATLQPSPEKRSNDRLARKKPKLDQSKCTLEEGIDYIYERFGQFLARFDHEIAPKEKEKTDILLHAEEVDEADKDKQDFPAEEQEDIIQEEPVQFEASTQNSGGVNTVALPVEAEVAETVSKYNEHNVPRKETLIDRDEEKPEDAANALAEAEQAMYQPEDDRPPYDYASDTEIFPNAELEAAPQEQDGEPEQIEHLQGAAAGPIASIDVSSAADSNPTVAAVPESKVKKSRKRKEPSSTEDNTVSKPKLNRRNKRGGKRAKKTAVRRTKSNESSTSSAELESPEREIGPELNNDGLFTSPSSSRMNRIEEEDEEEPMDVSDTNAELKKSDKLDDSFLSVRSRDHTSGDEEDNSDESIVGTSASNSRQKKQRGPAAGRRRSAAGNKRVQSWEKTRLQCPTIKKSPKNKTTKRRSVYHGESDEEEETPRSRGRKAKEKKEIFRWESFKWWLAYNLMFIRENLEEYFPNKRFTRNGKLHQINKTRIKKIDELIEFILKSQDSTSLEARVYLDTVFPDDNNYRFCKDYLKFNTIRHKTPPNEKREKRQSLIDKYLPRMRLCGALYLPLHSTSEEVIEAGREFLESNANLIWEEVTMTALRIKDPDGSLHKAETEFYKDVIGEKGDGPHRLPVPVFYPKSREDLMSPEFEKLLNKSNMVLIKDFGKTLGLDHSLYTIDKIAEAKPDMEINNIIQVPQSADDNFNPKGDRVWECFGTSSKQTDVKTTEYATYLEDQKKFGAYAFEALALCKMKDQTAVVKQLLDRGIEHYEIACDGFDKNMFGIRFATNIDLYDDAFQAQLEELKKLPLVLQPFTDRDLLDHCDTDVLGINTVQMYVKTPGSRTPAHMENSMVGSVNWNVGTGTCIWFVVTYEYWGLVKDLAKKHGHFWQWQDWWPSEEDLKGAGIPYEKFEQPPDATVWVGTGSLHWVQCNGYCVNVSWNVAQPTFTQLATSAIEHDHMQFSKMQQHVPLVTSVVNVAKNKKFVEDEEMVNIVRAILIRALGHQKWYFDYLEQGNLLPKGAGHQQGSFGSRCENCKCEVFNIVRWMLLKQELVDEIVLAYNKEREENEGKETKPEIDEKSAERDAKIRGDTYCGNCWPEDEKFETRYMEYSYAWTVEELGKILDNYQYVPSTTSTSPSTSEPSVSQ